MKSVTWKKAVDGAFDDAADWSRGVVPGPANSAVLGAGDGTAYIVTASRDETVNGLQTAANATLSIIGGTFTATAGTGKGVNAGVIDIASGGFGAGALVIGGTFGNNGAIVLEGSGPRLDFAGDTKLTGGGAVEMINGGDLGLFSSAFRLTNVDNTISGTGFFGNGTMTLVNGAAGVIDATGRLDAQFGGTVVNDGILEATTATGVLEIFDTAVDGSGGGSIVAGDGATVLLDGATIVGGTLKTSGSGAIETLDLDRRTVLDGRTSPVSLDGTLLITREAILTVEGSITNAGAISLLPDQFAPTLLFIGADCTLSGGGRLTLGNLLTLGGSESAIVGAGGSTTLTNLDNVISGTGEIMSSLSLVNGKAGVIDANVFGNSLTIDAGASGLVNAGLLEASGGVLVLPALKNTGIIEAQGGVVTVGGPVTGSGSAIVNDGALIFFFSFSQDVAFTGLAGFLRLDQSQGFGAHIAGFSKYGGTSLELSDIGFTGPGEASFSGGKTSGVLTVGDGTHTARLKLTGDYRNIVFTASDAGAGGVIITASGPVQTNSWLNAVDGSFDTASDWSLGVTPGMGQTADLAANGGGAYTVTVSSNETVNGLQTAANATLSITHGVFTATGGTGQGVNAGTIDIASNVDPETFVVAGVLDNSGAIVLEGVDSYLRLAADTKLTGGGAVTLDGGRISGASAAVTLTNVDNTLSGSGQIGETSLTLVNQAAGVIDANGTSDLTIDTGAGAVINAGLLEATNQATLRVGAVANGGVIEADGGNVIVSGAVTGSGSAVIDVGSLQFLSGFSQNVTFGSVSGILELDQSQGFGASITGFSESGGTLLDLKDLAFTGAGEASFSGTKTSGVLSVFDGTHAAHITLIGDYRHAVFTASSDNQGGVAISASNGPSPNLSGLIEAMATLGTSPAAHAPMATEPWRELGRPSLCRPHAALA